MSTIFPQVKAHTSVSELMKEAKWTEMRAKTILVSNSGSSDKGRS